MGGWRIEKVARERERWGFGKSSAIIPKHVACYSNTLRTQTQKVLSGVTFVSMHMCILALVCALQFVKEGRKRARNQLLAHIYAKSFALEMTLVIG